jgi:regulator of protease activity HflC (stomatin/prohibitin superfamily)
VLEWLGEWLLQFAKENAYVVFLAIYALVRACGTTVRSGTTGLLFSFGRARKIIPPGFRPLIPFLQIVRTLPTRSRTLDLPAQRVATREGLVYHVDANLVYRIVDVRRALVEVDHLEEGMTQMLSLSVQEVLRGLRREQLRRSKSLDEQLGARMQQRLEPWGVVVEQAGFPSITPSPKTVRLTQLDRLAREREQLVLRARRAGAPAELALPLIGAGQRVLRRRTMRIAAERAAAGRRSARRLIARIVRTRREAGVPLDGRIAARVTARVVRATRGGAASLELAEAYSPTTAR